MYCIFALILADIITFCSAFFSERYSFNSTVMYNTKILNVLRWLQFLKTGYICQLDINKIFTFITINVCP